MKINVGPDKTPVTVSDNFSTLPPAEQQKVVNDIASKLAQSKQPKVGLGEDVVRAAPSGLKTGTEMLIGTAEGTGSLGGLGAGKVAGWLGASPETVKSVEGGVGEAISGALNPVGRIAKIVKGIGGPDLTRLYAPTAQTVKEDTEAAVPALKSINYDPQTRAGKFVRTAAEFLPGMVAGPGGWGNIARRGVEQIATGLASEGAGQLTEGSAFEPWARFGGGLLGAGAMSGVARKGPVTPEAQAQLDAGNVLTAGQATRNKGLQKFESELGGGRHADIIEGQGQNYSAQAMQELGAPAGTLPHPENMLAQYRRIGNELNRVEAAVGNVPIPQPQQQAMLDAIQNYNDVVGPNARAPIVADTVRDIGALMRANGGATLNGEQLAALRTRLRTASQNADPQTAQALHAIQEQVDNAVGNHLGTSNPVLARDWARARQQYRLYLDLEQAMANSGAENAGLGIITPAQLRGGVRGVEGNRRLVQGQSEFTDLANEGAVAMPKVPDSGTAGRSAARVGTGLAAMGEPLAATASILGPSIAGRVLMSGPVQRMLMSAPENARAALTAIIAANQMRDRHQGGPR